jgi:hypothetical protein
MKALFGRSSSASSLEHLKRAARDKAECMSAGDIAWIVVGGVVVITGLVLLVQEIPAIVREVRIMRM